MKHLHWMLAASLTLAFAPAHAQDIALGILDDFNDDTVQGWGHGPVSPNPPTVIPLGGPDDSQYLENISAGGFGPGSRHIILNADARWTGDYIAAGVNKVRVNIANFGSIELPMRLAFRRVDVDTIQCWASTTASMVPTGATWANYEFIIDESTMTQVSGTASFEDALRDVVEIRVVASAEPSCMGDPVFGISGFDDFQTTADTDLDGINDTADNCTLVPNPRVCIDDLSIDNQADCETAGFSWGQPDSDADLYGNACDGDIVPGPFLSGDCIANFSDLNALAQAFFTSTGDPSYNPAADFNFDGSVGFPDLNSMREFFFAPPGPGLGNCGCSPDPSEFDPGEDFDGNELFVRGGLVLDWGATPQINNVVNKGDGTYQARFNVTAGSYGYKVADADWLIEYTNEGAPATEIGVPVELPIFGGFGNSSINVEESGCYEFNIVPLPGDPAENPAPAIEVTVEGPLP